MWKSGVGLFIGNSHHQAWGCLLAIRTIRRGAVYWQFATSGVGLFIGNSHNQAWGCLLAIRNIRRGAVYWQFAPSGVGLFIGNTHHQLSAVSDDSSLVSSLFNISLKCYSSLSEGIRKVL